MSAEESAQPDPYFRWVSAASEAEAYELVEAYRPVPRLPAVRIEVRDAGSEIWTHHDTVVFGGKAKGGTDGTDARVVDDGPGR